jgi:hypothetical protein
LDPKPKLLGFHMSGLTICPYTPNKETWRRAEKEIYFTAWDMLREEAK